jgi:hypothetical protein
MAGNAKDTREGPAMPVAHVCFAALCHRRAIASCFECERFCCERHLVAISLLLASSSVCIRVCPDCLQRYRTDPELQPLLKNAVTPFASDE